MGKRRQKKAKSNRRERQISVRGVRREPPDLRKLGRALIGLAMAQAEAEAEAEHQAKKEADASPSESRAAGGSNERDADAG